MTKIKRKKLKVRNFILFLLIIGALLFGGYYLFFKSGVSISNPKEIFFLASNQDKVVAYLDETIEGTIELSRGTKVNAHLKKIVEKDEKNYILIEVDGKEYYIDKEVLVASQEKVVLEKDIYVRTAQNLYSESKNGKLLTLVNKGEKLEVIGFDKINENGKVNMYKVKSGENEGYIYEKYVLSNEELANLPYDQDGIYKIHQERTNSIGGGNALNLDYYPVEKPKFSDNIMPNKVYALYLNCGSNVINNVDAYIELAKQSKINAFVVDIKDNKMPAYDSEVMKKYSPSNAEHAFNTVEEYKKAISKIKEAGFYVIGRITAFKDEYFAQDHKEYALLNKKTGELFIHSGTYWPSPYQREVWEFNVELAKEAVKLFGFNEIQFDYVRFPDRTVALENSGTIDFKNIYNEEKVQAIQRFLMYATDEIHQLNAYVSADVFGESAHTYVTAYGQYWPAISNVVDVISGMPYPDHFNKYEYGFTVPVWSVPYDILNYWGKNFVAKRQEEIPTPAIVRTWIQTYDTIREPYLTYGAKEVENQIRGLYDASLTGGYMTWNSGSNIEKYRSQLAAYSKEY